MNDLSIIIPARNEMFLSRTIDDILSHIEGNTNIIVVLDGKWAEPPIKDDKRITIIYHSVSIGQRAAMNEAVKLSKAKYVMKVDAHCSFDQGFDVKLMKDMQDDWTCVPIMRNLHAFDWVCKNGHRRYQSPSGVCKECGEPTTMDIVWRAKQSPQSTSYRFDKELHFQYFGEYKKRQIGDIVDTMSLQGSCFMCTRSKYWELGLADEAIGSWGQQGTEVALKTWLSGGRVVCNKKTWYAHMFRTQGGDFGFPYPLRGGDVAKARKFTQELFLNDRWDKAKYKLQWLIDKFSPVPGWNDKKLTKGIVYYTDNECNDEIAEKVRNQLKVCCNGHKLISTSLKPLSFGENIVLNEQRGILTMFKQILAGLEALDTDIVFLAEHDVYYHPSHFLFIPPKEDVYYYNENTWKVDYNTGHAVFYRTKQTSGLCAYRKLLIDHYRKRISKVEKDGFSRKIGFEPGSHNRPERIDDYKSESWMSASPNIDIRHDKNLTKTRWSPEEFRSQRSCRGWTESEIIPGWGSFKEVFK